MVRVARFEARIDTARDVRVVPGEGARRSALWLGEDVRHPSVPLPGRMRLRRNA